jgi:hypothetical protein
MVCLIVGATFTAYAVRKHQIHPKALSKGVQPSVGLQAVRLTGGWSMVMPAGFFILTSYGPLPLGTFRVRL